MEDKEPEINYETALKLGVSNEEFDRIVSIMGRVPNFTELSIYSVMWSEHCSYKNSIKYLKTLPREGGSLLVGAGEENAGLVDIGDGLACAFKIESHNHPSAIEPYQGAATGVGGIHRDIFTMGARPIAALNSLRFGNLELAKTKHLVRGVVRGIGDYGNCLGVPTIGGEVYFDPCYNQNILVNAMSVGIVKQGETVSAIAEGEGNPVFIVGSKTGKDGIHGATFASADLTEDSHEDLPAVQVGDPFQEKLLLEASLEAIQTGAMVGMQDMGAAGITCSTSEMSAKGGVGMVIHLDRVPTRQENMVPFEILLSESQERMLIVCKKGREDELIKVFEKWDLDCVEIGVVKDGGRLEYFHENKKVAEVDAESLVLGGGAPVYDREYNRPAYLDKIEAFDADKIPVREDFGEVLRTLLLHPNLVSKRWIYEQYDSMVRTNTVSVNMATDAAVIRVKGTGKAIAVTTDCNSGYVYADPYVGAMIAVSEAARNIACTGGEPLAITNCLNFGNPYSTDVYYQFVHAIKGMGEACRKFNTPVTGGNVSFYNQSVYEDRTEPVYPTPTIGMIGLIADQTKVMDLAFKGEGDEIYLIGSIEADIGSSQYLRIIHGVDHSSVPYFDLDEAHRLNKAVLECIKSSTINSAHDISEGGLMLAVLESCLAGMVGCEITYSGAIRKDAVWFGEGQNRVLIGLTKENKHSFEETMKHYGLPFVKLGKVGGDSIIVETENLGLVSDFANVVANRLKHIMEGVKN
jgi:phosphoribosylformylglycinamidine synthase subunit PurL